MKTDYIIITILIALFCFGMYVVTNTDFMMMEGYDFCNKEGYESVSFYGSYSEMEGKVECVSCYKLNCTYKEFKVKKNWLGIIKEVT